MLFEQNSTNHFLFGAKVQQYPNENCVKFIVEERMAVQIAQFADFRRKNKTQTKPNFEATQTMESWFFHAIYVQITRIPRVFLFELSGFALPDYEQNNAKNDGNSKNATSKQKTAKRLFKIRDLRVSKFKQKLTAHKNK